MTTLTQLQEAVCHAPRSGAAFAALGTALRERREIREAIGCFRTAVRLAPASVGHLLALGESLTKAALFDEAEDAYARALEVAPDSAIACAALGDLYLRALNRLPEARALCARAIAIDPNDRGTYVTLCLAHIETGGADGDVEELRARVEHALPSNGRLAEAHRALAIALRQVGRYEQARTWLRRQAAHDPANAAVLAPLGSLEHALGDTAAARAHLQQARDLAAGENTGEVYALCLQHAWRTGERREATDLLRAMHTRRTGGTSSARAPSSFAGRTILVVNDDGGGYGDWLLWSRLAPLMRALGARVLLECRAPLRPLFAAMPDVAGVLLPYDDCPPHDARYTVSELLQLLDWPWAQLEGSAPYLHVDAAQVERWRARLATYGDGVHVGVEWKTAGDYQEQDPYTQRAAPLEALTPLTRLPGVTAHALHVSAAGRREDAGVSPRVPLAPLARDVRDFLELAAAIAALDAVVTVDTAIAHLAGALGIPTIMMLPCCPDWRWGDAASPFAWYRSVRRVQQRTPGDWPPVVGQAADLLAAACEAYAHGHRQ